MLRQKLSTAHYGSFFLFVTLLLNPSAWAGEKVLYSFTGLADGKGPAASLVRDSAGNLYGTAPLGGSQAGQCLSIGGCGVVFELTPNSDGTWTETTIHTFLGGSDGIQPHGNLFLDSGGNLYGTTIYGGSGCGDAYYNCGTVYELSPGGKGSWTETILYNFQGGSDGIYPMAGLVPGSGGNLYGTTAYGAGSACDTLGCGTVFELAPGKNGTWTEHVLYVFNDGADGAEPGSPVVFDQSGNLYGTAAIGGNLTCNPPYGCGIIYRLTPGAGGWTEKVLHTFDCGKGGCFPSAGLAIDSLGNLYGNVGSGGAKAYGFVFMLSPSTGGNGQFSVLHSFDLTLGAQPAATLVFDSQGRLNGTTELGGTPTHLCPNGCGGVFRISQYGNGLDYKFLGFGPEFRGAAPQAGLIFDGAGNAYGTTSSGGPNGGGAVFEVTP